MAGKRVAPTLVALVETAAKDYGVEGRCRAELRALLAVARAADRWTKVPTTGAMHPKEMALCHALSRLDKASRAGDTKEGAK